MRRANRNLFFLLLLCGLSPLAVRGQIDPYRRDLIQLGYNGAFQGHAPLAVYAFYYRNQPAFLSQSNLTLRLAIAPTYVDSELGIASALGEQTDLGFGFAGGGFADNYYEIRRGAYLPEETFTGHSVETSASVYHLFNPGALIPLNGVLRGTAHYSFYLRNEENAPAFQIPNDHGTFSVRTGLRWGGKEPTLYPSLAMELSAWYEGQYRTGAGAYGLGGDHALRQQAHLFWGEALLAYTFPESQQNLYVSVTAGTSVDADRFSAYRLGALLPLAAEYPLSLPGYYYQEISARQFVLAGANYLLPLDKKHRWNFCATGATAAVDYLPGLEEPSHWLSGIGGGLLYQSSSLKVMIGYAYGVDAMRSNGRGAHSIGVLMQLDLAHAKQSLLNPQRSGPLHSLQSILGVLHD